ncbi:TRAP transporter small permease subunit [Emcibacter nanhaiensis]|uniref:TRAP transporter small permease protein n=2 Tax=Emcibacter nanhaiensis TaxID=1505037 RepID=A0A501PRT7_9PROT|nr:TRAP transporter small permease subunit [Emcibacter nanhaiensis]
MMLVIVFDVISRRFFVIGSIKLQELEWHLHGILFLCCLGFTYLKNAQVRVELLREKLSPRLQAWIEIVGCLLFLIPYCLVLVYFGFDFAHRAFVGNEVSSAAEGLPFRWIIKGFIPLGLSLLALAGIAVILRNMIFLSHGEDGNG